MDCKSCKFYKKTLKSMKLHDTIWVYFGKQQNRSSRFRSLKRHKIFLQSFCNLPVLIFAFQSLSVFSSLQLAVALSPSHLSAFFLIEKLWKWKCATVKVKVWHCESESVALETKFCYSNPKALMSLILQSINFIESPALRKPCSIRSPSKVWFGRFDETTSVNILINMS